MTYVNVRNDGAYVADMRKCPTGHSYTRKLEFAMMYKSYDAALADCCVENEHPILLTVLLGIH